MRTITLGAVAALAVFVVGSAVGAPHATTHAAKTTKLTAFLTVNQSIPAATGSGSGTFRATVTGRTIRWRMTFKETTGAVGAAHIHIALAGRANPAPAVTLCGPCRSGQAGTAKVTAAQLRKILGGATYVNLHTQKNPGGEIRGQIASA
jgi:hypothetical protein